MTQTEIKSKLITAGVENLREFGYPDCNEDSILTDAIYKQFFKSMLEDNKGLSRATDKAIDSLLKKVSD